MAVLALIVFALTCPSLLRRPTMACPSPSSARWPSLPWPASSRTSSFSEALERQGENRSDFAYRRTLLRGWTTAGTWRLLALL